MSRLRLLMGLLALTVLTSGWSMGQDKPEKRDTPAVPAKGTLPRNWKKLGLTDDQVQKVYKVQGDYRARINALKQQIKALSDEENSEVFKVLTDAQKTRLKELNSAEPGKTEDKKPVVEAKPTEKKPEEKKPEDKKP